MASRKLEIGDAVYMSYSPSRLGYVKSIELEILPKGRKLDPNSINNKVTVQWLTKTESKEWEWNLVLFEELIASTKKKLKTHLTNLARVKKLKKEQK